MTQHHDLPDEDTSGRWWRYAEEDGLDLVPLPRRGRPAVKPFVPHRDPDLAKHWREVGIESRRTYLHAAITVSVLPNLYSDHPVSYGMQVWIDGAHSGQPYDVFTDPDPVVDAR